jgi:hexosaminidase
MTRSNRKDANALSLLALAALSMTSHAQAAPQGSSAFLPVPRASQISASKGPLPRSFKIEWRGHRSRLLTRAAERFEQSWTSRLQTVASPGPRAVLIIECRSDDPGFLHPTQKEAYSLTLKAGQVHLVAEGPAGILYGLASLRQSVIDGPDGPHLALGMIQDAPRFVWRGIMIDVARHFMSLDSLKRQIDAMEQVKLNVLHLHLSDNEGFRVESRLYPKLHEVGAHGQYYSQAQIQDLVTYARDRGVRIVPEFDVPGHTLAILNAYPELASGPTAGANYISAMNSALNPTIPETYAFLDGLFGEMAGLFPDSYFHVGGDEVTGEHWAKNPQIQAFMAAKGLKSKVELEGYFHDQLGAQLRGRGKIVIGWEEIGRVETGKDTVIQAWRGSGSMAKATALGHPVIVSAGYYLDLLEPAIAAYRVDPQDPAASGLNPEQVATVRKHPIFGPRLADEMVKNPDLKLTQTQKALVLGGEAALWSELVTDEILDQRLWPRAAVVAERLWSPAEVRDEADLYRRLFIVQEGLRRFGLKDETNRAAMIANLAPTGTDTVRGFLDLVAPLRNHAHNHVLRGLLTFKAFPPQNFKRLADIAAPDSL